ncbi:hypothetical protein Tco_0317599 [Tanacetum coccineum]
MSDKGESFDLGDDIDEIDAFLAMEVSSDFEEGYFDSEGDITFLDNLLSDHLAPEVISDHDTSIFFSPRSDPLHHEFAGELIKLPSRIVREHEEYLNLITILCEISISRSQENVHANQSSIIESITIEDSNPVQEEIDIFLVPDDLIPPGVENDDSEDEDIVLPNNDHQDDPSIPRPPPEPPDVKKCLEPEVGILITKVFKGVSKPHDFMADILPTLVSDLTFISSFLSFGSEDTIFDPGIITFPFSYLESVAFSMEVSCSNDPVDTPMVEKSKLDEDTQGKVVDPTHYRGMIDTLVFLKDRLSRLDCAGCKYTRRKDKRNRLLVWLSKGRKALRYLVLKAIILLCLAVVNQIFGMDHSLPIWLGFNNIPIFHFIKEQVENGVVELYFVNTEYQLADIFTKALCRERIEFLINKLGMRSILRLRTLKNGWQMKAEE